MRGHLKPPLVGSFQNRQLMSIGPDKKFTRKLHKRLVEIEKEFFASRTESEKAVPPLQQLEEIISTLLLASTKLEEGRPLRFRVTYTEPCPIEHLALIFDFPPKDWNVEELRKLAPAVPPPSGHIGIWSDQYFGLVIWGLQTTGSTGITFEVIDPGRFVICFPMSLRVAEISGEKSGFINAEWNKTALNLMAVRKFKERNRVIDDLLSFLYGKLTQEILSQIRLSRHGGTILFVSEDDHWKRSLEKPITYDCMRRFNGIRHIEDALREELQNIADANTGTDHSKAILDRGMELLSSPQYNAFISDAARSIAHLTAIDGATVLSRHFDVLAFGAKVNVAQKGRKAEMVTIVLALEDDINSESSLSFEFRGKRHLSAARFVLNNSGSTAFVVSQDGGITALIMGGDVGGKTEEGLLAYKGLELLV